jgi:hypothetical protein
MNAGRGWDVQIQPSPPEINAHYLKTPRPGGTERRAQSKVFGVSCLISLPIGNRNGLQGIQERKQLLLLCWTQLAELPGYVLRLTLMAIDRLLQR